MTGVRIPARLPLENIIPPNPGIYLLVLRVKEHVQARIGALGLISLDKGFYVYLGSARGPGGLRSRVLRHISRLKRIRWHVDYLTSMPNVVVELVIVAETREDLEEVIASKLLTLTSLRPAVKGFGSSDKRSLTHLFKCIQSLNTCLEDIKIVLSHITLRPVVVNVITSGF